MMKLIATTLVSILLVATVAHGQNSVTVDGQPLDKIAITDDFLKKSLVYYSFRPGYEGPTEKQTPTPELLFTCTNTDSHPMYYVLPSILTFEEGKWTRFEAPFQTYEWIWVGRSMDAKYVWGVLDNVPEGPGHELKFVMSEDYGRSWNVGRGFKKYTYLSGFHDFRMNDKGEGKIIIHNPNPKHLTGPEVGYHSYSTSDWGRSWSEKRAYEPDFVEHAGLRSYRGGKDSVVDRIASTEKRYQNSIKHHSQEE